MTTLELIKSWKPNTGKDSHRVTITYYGEVEGEDAVLVSLETRTYGELGWFVDYYGSGSTLEEGIENAFSQMKEGLC